MTWRTPRSSTLSKPRASYARQFRISGRSRTMTTPPGARNLASKRALRPASVPQAPAGYPAGVRAGDWVFCSGIDATDFVHPTAPEAWVDPRSPGAGWNAEVVAQTKYIYKQLTAVAEAGGVNL